MREALGSIPSSPRYIFSFFYIFFLLCPPQEFSSHSCSFCCVLTGASATPRRDRYMPIQHEKVHRYTQLNDRNGNCGSSPAHMATSPVPPRLSTPLDCSPWQETQPVLGLITFLERGSRRPPEKVAALKGVQGSWHLTGPAHTPTPS